MKIRRREDLSWIGIDFDSILRREDDDIVVDEGIWIVKVFMFTPDADESPLRQASSGLSHPIECPDWPLLRIQRDVEQISSAIRPVTGFERPVSQPQTDFLETLLASTRGSSSPRIIHSQKANVIRSGLVFPNRGRRCWSNSSRLIIIIVATRWSPRYFGRV